METVTVSAFEMTAPALFVHSKFGLLVIAKSLPVSKMLALLQFRSPADEIDASGVLSNVVVVITKLSQPSDPTSIFSIVPTISSSQVKA